MTGFVVGLLDAFMAFDPKYSEMNAAVLCNKFHG